MFARHYVISKDGSKIHYKRFGNSKGPKVLMVHGMLGSWHMWLPFALPLIAKYEFIIPDMRGHGRSEMKSIDTSKCFELLAADLNAIIDIELKNTEYTIVAYSMGTIASLMYNHLYGWKNVKHYIHIDHGLDFGVSNGTNNLIFQDKHYAFSEIMDYAFSKLNEDPVKYLKYKTTDFNKEEQQMSDDILKIIGWDCTFSGIEKRFKHLRYWMIRPFIKLGVSYDQKFIQYCLLGHAYTSNKTDLSFLLKDLPTTTTFLVGKLNRLFSYDSQIKAISENALNYSVIEFAESGHDLIFNEYFKFMKTLNETLP